MAYNNNVYRVKNNSEAFTYLPQQEDYGVLYYLTSFGHEYLKQDYFMARNSFDFYMVNYTVKGSGVLVYDGKTYKLKKGDLCFIYMGNDSVYYPISDDLEIYFFHIKGPHIRRFYKQITEDGNYLLERFPEDTVKQVFYGLKTELIANKSYFESSKILNSFLIDMLEFSLNKEQEPYPQFVFNILLALRDVENRTIQDISKAVGYNPIYIERVFKKHTGKTLKQAISERNLEHAENLLLTSDLSISEIAETLGYANSNGFIIFFKKNTGMTPLEFKKKNCISKL